MVFPLVMCGCENWTIKEVEHWRTDAFELRCWRRLESPLDCKEIKPVNPQGNQSWIFIGRIGARKLKLQYFGHLMQRTDSLEKTLSWERLKAGGEWNGRGWDSWMASLTQWTWVWVGYGSWWWTGKPGVLPSMGSQRVGQDWANELNWTERSCLL